MHHVLRKSRETVLWGMLFPIILCSQNSRKVQCASGINGRLSRETLAPRTGSSGHCKFNAARKSRFFMTFFAQKYCARRYASECLLRFWLLVILRALSAENCEIAPSRDVRRSLMASVLQGGGRPHVSACGQTTIFYSIHQFPESDVSRHKRLSSIYSLYSRFASFTISTNSNVGKVTFDWSGIAEPGARELG